MKDENFEGTRKLRNSNQKFFCKKPTVLRHEGIIRGAKVDEPVPWHPQLQQDSNSVKRARHHGRPLVCHQIGIPHNPHIIKPHKRRLRPHKPGQLHPLHLQHLPVEMQQVHIQGVVHRPEHPPELLRAPLRPRNQVRQPGRPRRMPSKPTSAAAAASAVAGGERGWDELGGGRE